MKIAVIGETCIDKFIYCKCDRLSPEAPVPVLTPLEIKTNPGMSGNVVRNLIALDPEIKLSHFHQSIEITKTRFVEKKSNHMFFRFDEGELEVDHFMELHDFSDFDITVVSDYNKGFLSEADLINISKTSKLSILDSKRKLSKENLQIISNTSCIMILIFSKTQFLHIL